MKSLLFQNNPPFDSPPACTPCRQEKTITIRKNGRLYHFTARDKVVVEDPYLVMLKAAAFGIGQGEPYSGAVTPRSIRDFLIKTSLVI